MRQTLCKTAVVSVSGLLIAAFIVVVASVVVNPKAPRVTLYSTSQPITLSSSNSQLVVGSGFYDSERVINITQLETVLPTGDAMAVLSGQPEVSAELYPFAYINGTLKNSSSNTFFLFWRSSAEPEVVHAYELEKSNQNVGWIQLIDKDGWAGRILEFGLIVRGRQAENPIRVPTITLHDNSLLNALALIHNDWTRVTSPTQSSINATSRGPQTPYVSITSLGAIWALASITICFAAYRRRPTLNSLCIQMLIPWICMDLLWARDFVHQAYDSVQKFRFDADAAQYLEDPDPFLAKSAFDIKKIVVSQGGKRVFIVHPSLGHNFERLRLQFHLLPLNVYNFGRFPPINHLRAGDFLLIFNGQRVKYLVKKEMLAWGKQRLRVDLLESNDMLSLYRVSS